MVFKFTIDKYLDPHIPRSQVHKLPKWIAHFLGHRGPEVKPEPDYIFWLDVFIGTFVGLLTVEGIFLHSGVFKKHHAPVLIASYGASAILIFNTSQVPLAQPRNVFFGQVVSSVIGTCLFKLFELSQEGRDHMYVGAALATAISSVVMSILGCIHPPSGATALILFTDPNGIGKMGWWYIPVHLVSTVVLLSVGLITNNLFRSYPVYWWTSYLKPKPEDSESQEFEIEEMKMDKLHIKDNQVDTLGFSALNNDSIVPSQSLNLNPLFSGTTFIDTGKPTSKEREVVISAAQLYIPSVIEQELSEIELQLLSSIKLKLEEYEEYEHQKKKQSLNLA